MLWPDPEFPNWITTLPMPHARRERYSKLFTTLLVLLLFVLASIFPAVSILQDGWSNITPLEMAIMGIFFVIPLGLIVSMFYQSMRERKFTKRRYQDTKWTPWLRALTRARIPFQPSGDRASSVAYQRLVDELASESLECPRTLADLRLASQLHHIELPDVLLEAEKVFPGSRIGRRRARTAIYSGCFFILIGLIFMNTFFIAIGLISAIIPLMSMNFIRRKTTGLRIGFGVPVAGTGFLQINDELCFRSDNSICLVRGIDSDRRSNPAVEVWFISPEATRYFSFPSCGDPHFVALWQRWNHPQPRPELAGHL